jgi:hypothetical protein
MPKNFTWGSHCRSPKGDLAFIEDCGIFGALSMRH